LRPATPTAPQLYTFKATARYGNATTSSSDTLSLLATASTLVASLEGPSGAVRADGEATFSAAGSYDPDDPDSALGALAFVWSCSVSATGGPCFDGCAPWQEAAFLWLSCLGGLMTPQLLATQALFTSE
jgi:hypothetical protein